LEPPRKLLEGAFEIIGRERIGGDRGSRPVTAKRLPRCAIRLSARGKFFCGLQRGQGVRKICAGFPVDLPWGKSLPIQNTLETDEVAAVQLHVWRVPWLRRRSLLCPRPGRSAQRYTQCERGAELNTAKTIEHTGQSCTTCAPTATVLYTPNATAGGRRSGVLCSFCHS